MADLGYFRIEQCMLSRAAGAKAGASAAYQAAGRFRTVIAAAAYQAGVGLTIGADLREAWAAKGQYPVSAVADFTGKSGVHHTDIRVPAGAPAWCADRQTLWTRVELSERRRDATLTLQYTLSLSREVPIATSIRSVERGASFWRDTSPFSNVNGCRIWRNGLPSQQEWGARPSFSVNPLIVCRSSSSIIN